MWSLVALLCGGVSAQTPSRSGGLDINAFQRALPAPGETTPGAAKVQYPQALSWDTQTREIHAKDGEQSVDFRFTLTNVWTNAVTITGTKTSCGCTVARLPETPWVIPPGKGGEISGNMNLLGKSGTVVKTVTVSTDVGSILLNVKVHIAPPDPTRMRAADRQRNLAVAAADRQAVFRGECASCHVTPTVGKKGAELYATACGICHDAENKATMVPALRELKHPTDRAFWMQWIRNGKANSLMPAFDLKQGGILDEAQMASLADFLDSAAFKPGTANPPAKTAQP
jgi:cytochrome c553